MFTLYNEIKWRATRQMTAYEGHVGTGPLDETERGRRKGKGWGVGLCLLFFYLFSLSSPTASFFFPRGWKLQQ
jgi:hypothetical protein